MQLLFIPEPAGRSRGLSPGFADPLHASRIAPAHSRSPLQSRKGEALYSMPPYHRTGLHSALHAALALQLPLTRPYVIFLVTSPCSRIPRLWRQPCEAMLLRHVYSITPRSIFGYANDVDVLTLCCRQSFTFCSAAPTLAFLIGDRQPRPIDEQEGGWYSSPTVPTSQHPHLHHQAQ